MKTKLVALLRMIWKPLIALIGLIILIVWTTGVLSDRVEPGVLDHAPGFALPPDAETVTVRIASIPQRIEVVGTTISENTVSMHARMSAHVSEVLVSAGDSVSRDEVLIRLDDRDLRSQREAAQAALHRTKTEYERFKKLHQTQAATEQQLIAAESAYHTAKAEVDRADVALTFTEIRSPMNGIVTDRHVEVGTLADPGQTLLRVYDPAAMRLDAPVPVRLVDYLAIGDTLDIRLERPDTVMQGRVRRIVSEIDPRTRTQTVQIMLEPNDTPVLPGTFGRVRIPTTERDVYLIADTAVYRVGQLEMTQVLENERVIRRLVKTGETRDGRVEVLSGLQEGDVVLVRPVK